MQAAATQKAFVSGAVARPVARRSVAVRATAARPQAEKKQQNGAMIALAGFAAAVLVSSAAPAMAEDKVKSAVCASNPTSKICLKDSAK